MMSRNTRETRYICWFSFARSGSNYLSDLMAGFDHVVSFREIFQARGLHAYNTNSGPDQAKRVVRAACAEFGRDYASFRDEALIDDVRSQPSRLFRALENASDFSDDDIFSFKLFPDHLDNELVDRDILGSQKFCNIAYFRSPLETFISARKVQLVQSAIVVDTTSIKPTLDLKKFKAWRKRRRDWVRFINSRADKFAGFVRYEDLKGLPTESAISRLQGALHKAGVDLDINRDKIETTTLQDKSSALEDKVENLDEFIAQCSEEGIDPYTDEVPLTLERLL